MWHGRQNLNLQLYFTTNNTEERKKNSWGAQTFLYRHCRLFVCLPFCRMNQEICVYSAICRCPSTTYPYFVSQMCSTISVCVGHKYLTIQVYIKRIYLYVTNYGVLSTNVIANDTVSHIKFPQLTRVAWRLAQRTTHGRRRPTWKCTHIQSRCVLP